jgi:hypothetical protein
MKTKIQIISIFGKVLFEYKKENNTIKDTVEAAVRDCADLDCADLRGADLRGADLRGVDLCDADLRGADLRGANLGGADFGEFGKLLNSQDILTVGPIGSRSSYTTIIHTDKGIYVQCGCFKGTLDEFVSEVKETHQGNKYEKDYLALVEFVKIKFK